MPPLLPLLLDNVPPGLHQMLAQEGIAVRRRTAGLCEGRFVLSDSRRGLSRPDRGQTLIDVAPLCRGLAPEPLSAVVDQHARPHQWEFGGHRIQEEIACVDKRTVRETFLGRLRDRLHEAGGLWLRLAAFPFPYRSALNLRIDHDQHVEENFRSTLELLEGHQSAATHFVNGAAYEAFPGALARLQGMDVGSHGYRHHTYRTEDENLYNIARGISVLRKAGIDPSGFAAPHGRFNAGLLAALEKLAVGHSSEFGLAYDDLPFFPEGKGVLQIPVHPVCPEIFLESLARALHAPGGDAARLEPLPARTAIELAVHYFHKTAQEKYQAGEPLFFYGHPAGRLDRVCQVFAALFRSTAGMDRLWHTTLTEFAAWWRARGAVRLTLKPAGEQLRVEVDQLPRGYRLGLELCCAAGVALLPLETPTLEFSPTAVDYQPRPPRSGTPPLRVDPPHGLRGQVKRWLDWELETPPAEIPALGVRHWTKWALRRWRG